MHDHDTCEQLMSAAQRSGMSGRLEYLAQRCDVHHGRLRDDDNQENPDA
jgi:hypothetical protein